LRVLDTWNQEYLIQYLGQLFQARYLKLDEYVPMPGGVVYSGNTRITQKTLHDGRQLCAVHPESCPGANHPRCLIRAQAQRVALNYAIPLQPPESKIRGSTRYLESSGQLRQGHSGIGSKQADQSRIEIIHSCRSDYINGHFNMFYRFPNIFPASSPQHGR